MPRSIGERPESRLTERPVEDRPHAPDFAEKGPEAPPPPAGLDRLPDAPKLPENFPEVNAPIEHDRPESVASSDYFDAQSGSDASSASFHSALNEEQNLDGFNELLSPEQQAAAQLASYKGELPSELQSKFDDMRTAVDAGDLESLGNIGQEFATKKEVSADDIKQSTPSLNVLGREKGEAAEQTKRDPKEVAAKVAETQKEVIALSPELKTKIDNLHKEIADLVKKNPDEQLQGQYIQTVNDLFNKKASVLDGDLAQQQATTKDSIGFLQHVTYAPLEASQGELNDSLAGLKGEYGDEVAAVEQAAGRIDVNNLQTGLDRVEHWDTQNDDEPILQDNKNGIASIADTDPAEAEEYIDAKLDAVKTLSEKLEDLAAKVEASGTDPKALETLKDQIGRRQGEISHLEILKKSMGDSAEIKDQIEQVGKEKEKFNVDNKTTKQTQLELAQLGYKDLSLNIEANTNRVRDLAKENIVLKKTVNQAGVSPEAKESANAEIEANNKEIKKFGAAYKVLTTELSHYERKVAQKTAALTSGKTYLETFQDAIKKTTEYFSSENTPSKLIQDRQLAENGLDDPSQAREALYDKLGLGEEGNLKFAALTPSQYKNKLLKLAESAPEKLTTMLLELRGWATDNPREAVALSGNIQHTFDLLSDSLKGSSKSSLDDLKASLARGWNRGTTENVVHSLLSGTRPGIEKNNKLSPELLGLLDISAKAPYVIGAAKGLAGEGTGSWLGSKAGELGGYMLAGTLSGLSGGSSLPLTGALVTAGSYAGGALGGMAQSHLEVGVGEQLRKNVALESGFNALIKGINTEGTLQDRKEAMSKYSSDRKTLEKIGNINKDLREGGVKNVVNRRVNEFTSWLNNAGSGELFYRALTQVGIPLALAGFAAFSVVATGGLSLPFMIAAAAGSGIGAGMVSSRAMSSINSALEKMPWLGTTQLFSGMSESRKASIASVDQLRAQSAMNKNIDELFKGSEPTSEQGIKDAAVLKDRLKTGAGDISTKDIYTALLKENTAKYVKDDGMSSTAARDKAIEDVMQTYANETKSALLKENDLNAANTKGTQMSKMLEEAENTESFAFFKEVFHDDAKLVEEYGTPENFLKKQLEPTLEQVQAVNLRQKV